MLQQVAKEDITNFCNPKHMKPRGFPLDLQMLENHSSWLDAIHIHTKKLS